MTLARAYTVGQRTRVEHEADVFGVPADALVFGRCGTVRSRAEAISGKCFEPALALPYVDWPCAHFASTDLPWHYALSVGYRARSRAPFATFTMPRLPHVSRLARGLGGLLHTLRHRSAARTVAIMPLSWRNPEVVACATISAVRCHATSPECLQTVKIVTHDTTEVPC